MKLGLSAIALLLSMVIYGQQLNQTTHNGEVRKNSKILNSNDLFKPPMKDTDAMNKQSGFGTHSCKSHELNEKHFQERGILNEYNQAYLNAANNVSAANINKTPGVNEISVIFHVVYNPSTPGSNVSNAAIMDVYDDIVEDFQLNNADAANARSAYGFTPADANINFCLATQDPSGNPLTEIGVVRVATTEDWYDSDNGEENKMKSSATGGSQIWNRNNYLNVWICDISNGAGFGTAGYAYRPAGGWLPNSSIDGIVIDYNIGMGPNILTHEIGHYLGLDHTWGGSGNCTADDGFGDTPQTQGPSFNFSGSCSGFQETCSGTQTMYENYMDYSNCTVMFTQNQSDYMLGILQGLRSSLLSSPGCDPTNTPPNSAFNSIPAGPGPVVIPVNGGVNFVDQSTNAPTGWSWTISGTEGVDWSWINATNAASQNPQAEFYTVGFYDVTLTASNGFGVDATPAIENSYVQVVAPSTGTACDTLRNYDPASEGVAAYSLEFDGFNDWGAMVGHGGYDETGGGVPFEITHYSDMYTASASAELRQLLFPIYQADDLSGAGLVKINVHNDDAAGIPGTIALTDTFLIADMNAGAWNTFDFSNPVTVTGNFWVSFEFEYGATQDTVVIGMVDMNDRALTTNTNTLYQNYNGNWAEISANYGPNWVSSLYMDVLLSNGPDPAATFTATSDSVCVGGDILVNGSGSTNVTNYGWYVTDDPFTTIITESDVPTNTFNFPTAGNFSIYLFGDGSCKTDAVIMPVVVNPAVSATITSTSTSCGLNNGVLTVSGETGGDGNYYYSLDGVTYQVSPVFDSLPAGDYDLYVTTVGDNCETMTTVNVAASVEFVAGVSANTSICPGGNVDITASGGVTYEWFDGATLISSVATANVSPAATTQYSCTVTDAAGCQSTVYTTVTLTTPTSAPTITANGPLTFCDGGSVELTSSEITGNLWSTSSTSNTITVSESGDYTVSYTDVNGCTSDLSATTTVSVSALPTITIGTVNNPTVCATPTGDIEVTGTGTGVVSWTGTASGSSASVVLPYTITGLTAGSYNISFVDGSTCTSNVVNQSLSDPTPPTTPTISASGALTFCQGGSVDLTSSELTGNTWSSGGVNTQTITATTSGTYSVTFTDVSGCSAASAPIVVTVNALPATPTISANGTTTFCQGGSVDLTSSQGSGNIWSSTETTQTITVNGTGNYSVTYTDLNGCSSTSASTAVTVNALPSTPTISASGPLIFCDGGSVDLTSSEATGNVWSTTETSGVISATTTGDYTVTYTDVNGCIATSAITNVVVNALPMVDAGIDQSVCDASAVTLSGAGASTYAWDNGITDGAPFTPAIGTITYNVIGTDVNGCSNTDMVDVTVNSLPTVTFGTLSALCVYNSPVTLTGGLPASGTYSGSSVTGTSFDPSVGIGSYDITYSYTDVNGCSNSAISTIVVDGCAGIEEDANDIVSIYPNPTSDIVTVSAGSTINFVRIYDGAGRLVLNQNGSSTSELKIDLTSYSGGLYTIEVSSENSVFRTQLVNK